MKRVFFVFAACCLALLSCGKKNPNHWFNAAGEDCSAGLPFVDCYYHSSGAKITMQEDPYYLQANLSGLSQWTSADGIQYQISCACPVN